MFSLVKPKGSPRAIRIPGRLSFLIDIACKSPGESHLSLEGKVGLDQITKIINDHPLFDQPLFPILQQHIPSNMLSWPLVEDVLGRLFGAHSNGLKAYEFFKYSLQHCSSCPTTDAFEKTLHILVRMRYFDKAWELMEEIRENCPSLLTFKSMSIMLSKIAKFQSYEDAIEAFERMEKDIFVARRFGIDEFNVLLRAFCTQRQMKEAKSVFQKMYSRFFPNVKTMNLLLLGFKESGDVTSVELFYHEMVRRGFKPNVVTYNIRIDAYCKKGYLGDALRLVEEMERANCFPTLETITTLIHGAGVARNPLKGKQLFDELASRNLNPDVGAYNALISALIKCRDVKTAIELMHEMEEKQIGHDGVTYHTMVWGLMRVSGIEGVSRLYQRMVESKFVPKMRTVVMLVKLFCQNERLDLALNLWRYLIERGYCPHRHALDLLATGLCSHGRVQEAFECSVQMLERGRHMSEAAFLMLKRFLLEAGEAEKLKKVEDMRTKLQVLLPPLKELAVCVLS